MEDKNLLLCEREVKLREGISRILVKEGRNGAEKRKNIADTNTPLRTDHVNLKPVIH